MSSNAGRKLPREYFQPYNSNATTPEWPPNPYEPFPIAIPRSQMRSPLCEGGELVHNAPGPWTGVPRTGSPSSVTVPWPDDHVPLSSVGNLLHLESKFRERGFPPVRSPTLLDSAPDGGVKQLGQWNTHHEPQQRPVSDSTAVESPTNHSFRKSADSHPERPTPLEREILDEQLAMQGLRAAFGPAAQLPEDEDEFLAFVARRVLELAAHSPAIAKLSISPNIMILDDGRFQILCWRTIGGVVPRGDNISRMIERRDDNVAEKLISDVHPSHWQHLAKYGEDHAITSTDKDIQSITTQNGLDKIGTGDLDCDTAQVGRTNSSATIPHHLHTRRMLKVQISTRMDMESRHPAEVEVGAEVEADVDINTYRYLFAAK
ncbi:hypothetical protein SISSUDRAFT_1064281 [Sistotremastrum suecicum HHB10207 ss-3]|uniref:Uncharacterized protein n=1 Tax=Sistotremastrum suecicum HHB10207 ss-3 TaxID=1314776 RepID=A0A166AUL4_9AGAM|nr:hypothetical protein SISSUDRAFT_1064281 [Sistotremastrum suecicum HHB10207 ss-3]